MNIENLSKEELIKLCKLYSKNWLAHDGCWFLATEEKYGLDKAIEIDKKSWERFTVIEAKRIMEEFGIEDGGGLDSLEKALKFRLYATVNKQTIERVGNKLIFKMVDCRVQSARQKKGLTFFPCKEVGEIEYSLFAKTIDNRIETKCIGCPQDEHKGNFYCGWAFTLR